MQTHYLKTWPEYFLALKTGFKDFEVRYNDRNYKIDDIIICQEYDPETREYSGNQLTFKIKYIVSWNDNVLIGTALKVGYIIMGLESVDTNPFKEIRAFNGAVETIKTELSKKEDCYNNWVEGIEKAFINAHDKRFPLEPMNDSIILIANEAAKNFLDSLCR